MASIHVLMIVDASTGDSTAIYRADGDKTKLTYEYVNGLLDEWQDKSDDGRDEGMDADELEINALYDPNCGSTRCEQFLDWLLDHSHLDYSRIYEVGMPLQIGGI